MTRAQGTLVTDLPATGWPACHPLAADGMVTAGPVLGARGGEMQS